MYNMIYVSNYCLSLFIGANDLYKNRVKVTFEHKSTKICKKLQSYPIVTMAKLNKIPHQFFSTNPALEYGLYMTYTFPLCRGR